MTDLVDSNNVEEVTVAVRNACKHYGRKNKAVHVLKNLNMTVPKGVIYGLLGSSGCGKTTLLTCIVGMKKLNSGEMWVMGGAPGTKDSKVPGPLIGYMPQNVGVQLEFTTRETMHYFGKIAGLNSEKINTKIEFLKELLMLPDINKPLGKLSGGQQRRISFAAALMHNPELLILDEPTVGLDPLLRESIWSYLLNLTTKYNVTVILTTHYIDEARRADIVALLRDGCLLSEEKPDTLLTRFSATTLEEVFLILSTTQCKEAASKNFNCENGNTNNRLVKPLYTSSSGRTLKSTHLKPLLLKNAQWLLKNPGLILFNIIVPVLQIILFHFAIGHDPSKLIFAISNYETNLTKCGVPTCDSQQLSCNFLHYFTSPAIELLHYGKEKDALESVFRGNAHAAITFKHNYTVALKERIALPQLHNWNTSHSTIEVVRDLSTFNVPLFVKKEIIFKFNDFIGDYLESCGNERRVLAIPIKMNEHIYGKDLPDYAQFAIPAVCLTAVCFFSSIAIASEILAEFQSGVTERTLVMGADRIYIAMSHFITEFALTIFHIVAVVICAFFITKLPLHGSIVSIILLFFLMSFWGLGFGIFLASVCTSDSLAIYIIIGSFFPAGVLSGLVWPVECMPKFIQIVAAVLPFAGSADSMRSVLQRGWDLTNYNIYTNLICILIWNIIFLIASIIMIKVKKYN